MTILPSKLFIIFVLILTTIFQLLFSEEDVSTVRLFIGDVMLGRGVDQLLPYHVNPVLFERWVKDANEYVDLSVKIHGAIPPNRSVSYVWGEAIQIFHEMRPDIRIVNLEAAVTHKGEPSPAKNVHCRMHPKNVAVIQAAGIHCCVLSNNHALDWGRQGLNDTLNSLRAAGIATVGAGHNVNEAETPAIFKVSTPDCRVLIFGAASQTAGIPNDWTATEAQSGVHLFDETLSADEEIKRISQLVKRYKTQQNDIVVFSLHWGSNWGWAPEQLQQEFARRLIDEAQVDVVYGYSSHRIKGVEVYHGKVIIYGGNDLISDYEGIKDSAGVYAYRYDLSLMFFLDIDSPTGNLHNLQMTPTRVKRLQVRRAVDANEEWLFETMQNECAKYGTKIFRLENGDYSLIFQ